MTGSASDSSLRWLDENTLIFVSGRGGAKAGQTAFYTLDIRGGEAALAFTVPLAVKLYRPLADGRWFVLTRRPMESAEGLDPSRAQPGRDYTVYEELPFWADGIGVVSGTRMSGWVFNPADGSGEQVTSRNFDAEGAAVSPDGRSVLYWGVEFENIRPDWKQFLLWDSVTGETRSLIPDGKYRATQAGWWGDEIWFEATAPHTSVYRAPELYLLDPASGECRSFCAPDGFLCTFGIGDMSLGAGTMWKVSGEYLYAQRLNRGDTELLRFDKAGNFSSGAKFEGLAGFDVYGNDAYLVAFREHRPQEIYRQSLAAGEAERLTHFHDEFLASHEVSAPEHIIWRSRTGEEMDGWIIKPAGYVPGRKYPGVLNIHGGPKAAYSGQYYHEMQLLAAAGALRLLHQPARQRRARPGLLRPRRPLGHDRLRRPHGLHRRGAAPLPRH